LKGKTLHRMIGRKFDLLLTLRRLMSYIYDISRLRVKDLHSATYIYVVRRLRVKKYARS
jgi:hypothetical protein